MPYTHQYLNLHWQTVSCLGPARPSPAKGGEGEQPRLSGAPRDPVLSAPPTTLLGRLPHWTPKEAEAQGGDVTGPGESTSTVPQGHPSEGTKGDGRHSWTVPHFGHGQVALPRGLRAHLRPWEVPVGPRLARGGRGKSWPWRCRHKWRGTECFFLPGPGAHPLVQK